tara:strand:- start:15237 stop:15833 length:597 start_codon:yes stop_codon:yes gene_type:complete
MKNPNLYIQKASVTRRMREKLNKHKSAVIWFTGLSGSGKSTIAHAVEEELYKQGCITFVLDGDNVRRGLCSNLSFSDRDRKENIRRIGEASNLMMQAGVIVMAAFISPFRHDRNSVRKQIPKDSFFEIYCSASLETCESRDTKGLYKLARKGKIKDYTGIDSPYEAPENPDLSIDTGNESLQDSVTRVINLLNSKNIF